MRNRVVDVAAIALVVSCVALVSADTQRETGRGQPLAAVDASTAPQLLAAAASGCIDVERYSEDFETGWASNWYRDSGFQVAGAGTGKALAGGGTTAAHASYLSGDYWADFYFGLKLKLISGETWVSFRYNSDGSLDYPYDRVNPTASHRYYAAFTSASATLVRDDAGTMTVLGSKATSFDPSRSYAVGIFAVGGTLALYVDNTLLLSVTDAKPVASGTITLETRANASAQFDDLQVVASVPCAGSWTQTKTFPTGVDINVISFDPSNRNIVYAGTEHAGVWKSADGGLTWTEIGYSGDMSRLGKMRTIAVAPSDSNIVYGGWVVELDKSVDGGAHWSRTSVQNLTSTISGVAVHPTNPSLVYIGVGGSLLAGGGSTGGLYKSSDGGSTTELVLGAPINAIAMAASAPTVLYAGTASGISKSTDSGVTWASVYTYSGGGGPNSGVLSVAVDSSNANTAYAVADGIIKTTDGGTTWTKIRSGNAIIVSPSRPEVLYAMDGGSILRSDNRGVAWTAKASLTTKPYSLMTIAVDPTNPDKVFAGTWGQGIFLTADGGKTWSEPTMFVGPADLGVAVAIHPNDSKTVYIGTSKGEIYRTADAGDTWSRLAVLGTGNLYQSLITGLVINPSDPTKVFASNLEGIYKSTDGGATWKTVNTGLTDSRIISLAIDPKNPNRLYAGTGNSRPRNISDGSGMFYSVNAGESWAAVSGFPAAPVPSIAVSTSNPNVIYAAAIGYGAYKSVNAGSSWTQVNSGLESQACLYTLAVDPQNPDVAYAGTTNSSYCQSVINHPDNVYKTTDGGLTWKISRKGETIYENVENIAIDPSNPNNIYATNHTERIWFSGDAGATWKLANQNVIRHGAHLYLWALAIDSSGSMIYMTTCGRGVLRNSAKVQESASTTGASLALSPSGLRFAAINNGGTLTTTSAQTVTASQTGSGTVFWSAAADKSWVTISPASGSGTGTLRITINNTGGVLPASGDQSATITVTAMGASTPSLTLPVTVTLYAAGSTAAPYGVFDTPTAGQVVQGSIAVTGWSLDDVEVDHVEIWRDLVAGETTPPYSDRNHPGYGKVYVANPLFVPGSRPDVELAHGTTPLAYRAGWGYLLLTWGLWNQGNGRFTLYAFAFDKEGHYTTLGTKTITSSNATATKPFGAIDTPSYGQTVTSSFWNFGWALTPTPNAADTRNCRITNGNVYTSIDSGTLIPVSYGDLRADIAAAFPGFSNAMNASGAYYVDVSGIADGTHTIGWYVVDGCGRAEGVGSRFFSVAKSSLASAGETLIRPAARLTVPLAAAAESMEPVTVRRLTGESNLVYPDSTGTRVLTVGQDERIEVQLPSVDGASYVGSQLVNGEPRPLPIGSSLRATAGLFAWQPAAGFLGSFDLAFTAASQTLRVRVVVGPPIRMAIDLPPPGVAEPGLVVAGWAIDLAAREGSGVDTVHVWAHPTDGRAPIFLGVAAVGDPRPDVAHLYGPQFTDSGYTLQASALPAGTYDLVVYPHRAATNRFDGAQSVRITAK